MAKRRPTVASAAAPQVSVCIPTYNYGHFLGAAIESVLDQDFGEFELVVVDNASDDDTATVVERYRDPRLRFHRNDRNIGLFGNFARCLELSTAPFVKFLAADDWLHPAYLREAVALMRRHPALPIVSGPGFFVDAEATPLVSARRASSPKSSCPVPSRCARRRSSST